MTNLPKEFIKKNAYYLSLKDERRGFSMDDNYYEAERQCIKKYTVCIICDTIIKIICSRPILCSNINHSVCTTCFNKTLDTVFLKDSVLSGTILQFALLKCPICRKFNISYNMDEIGDISLEKHNSIISSRQQQFILSIYMLHYKSSYAHAPHLMFQSDVKFNENDIYGLCISCRYIALYYKGDECSVDLFEIKKFKCKKCKGCDRVIICQICIKPIIKIIGSGCNVLKCPYDNHSVCGFKGCGYASKNSLDVHFKMTGHGIYDSSAVEDEDVKLLDQYV